MNNFSEEKNTPEIPELPDFSEKIKNWNIIKKEFEDEYKKSIDREKDTPKKFKELCKEIIKKAWAETKTDTKDTEFLSKKSV
jgi:DNA-binding ferritin-like protein (Dps family)